MERLTKYVDGEVQPNHGYKQRLTTDGSRMVDVYVDNDDISAKLAAYEDTGLTPDEVKRLIIERDALKAMERALRAVDGFYGCYGCISENKDKCFPADKGFSKSQCLGWAFDEKRFKEGYSHDQN